MIAFLCHPYHRGGVTRWMVDFADECTKNGEQVIFVTVNPRKPFTSAGNSETLVTLLGRLKNNNIKVVNENVGWEFEFGSVLYKTYIYIQLLKKYIPDGTPLITSDDHACWNTSRYLANRYRYIGVLHSDDKAYYELAKEFHPYIKTFVCVSQRVKKTVLEICKACEKKKFDVIPCGIRLPIFKQVSSVDDTLKIVFVGRISDPQKRPLDIASVVESLSKRHVSFSLKIIGDGPEKPLLEERLNVKGLSGYVHFLGWQGQETIYNELSDSQILLLTSEYEGMPIVVMEALACGCAIISTKVSGVEDYAQSELNDGIIWLNDIGDTEQAATNILLAQENGFDRIKARNFAEHEFSMELCYQRYMSIIRGLDEETLEVVSFPRSSLAPSYFRALARNMRIHFMK